MAAEGNSPQPPFYGVKSGGPELRRHPVLVWMRRTLLVVGAQLYDLDDRLCHVVRQVLAWKKENVVSTVSRAQVQSENRCAQGDLSSGV